MKNPYVNKLGMYLVVNTVLETFSAVFASIPAAVRLITKFKGLIAEIRSRSSELDKGTTGETDAKWKAEDDMSENVSALVGMLHAYATEIDDMALMQKSDVCDSDIDETRDAERASLCTSLVDMVEEKKVELVDYDVTDEDIAESRSLIKAYEDQLAKRNALKASQGAERKSIDALFRSADRVLNKQLDKLVAKQKNAALKQSYEAARVIKDVAATRRGDGEGAQDTTEEGTQAQTK